MIKATCGLHFISNCILLLQIIFESNINAAMLMDCSWAGFAFKKVLVRTDDEKNTKF